MSKVDKPEIHRALEAGQNILDFLSSRSVRELDDPIKNEIHSTALSCELLQSRIFNSRSRKLDKAWEGLSMQEYMFSKYIRHYNDIDQLGCTICKDMFPCTQDALREHVESGIHIRKYLNIVSSDFNDYWIDESTMLKYGKFMDFDGPNGKIFCKVCFIEVEKDKLELLKHFKENRHKESFKDIVCAITGSKCGNESSDFLSSYSSRKNQQDAGHSSSSSSSNRNESSISADSRPAKKTSFTRKLVDARLSGNVQKPGVENLNNVTASNTKSTPSQQNNSTRSSCEENQATSTSREKRHLNSTPSPSASSSGSPTHGSVPQKKKSFTKKIVEARLNETVKEDRGGTLNSKVSQSSYGDECSSSSSRSRSSLPDLPNEEETRNFHLGRQSTNRPRRILFDNIRKAADVHRMHFMVSSIEDTNLITPIGLEGVPSHIQNKDIYRACDVLGDVVRVERQTIKENVIIYIVLSNLYKNVFGKGLEVQIGWTKYKILNPFLYS